MWSVRVHAEAPVTIHAYICQNTYVCPNHVLVNMSEYMHTPIVSAICNLSSWLGARGQ